MRRAAKVDANQDQVVSALRAAGATVQSLAAIGKGAPDLLVSFRDAMYLLEVKDGSKPPSARALTEDQVRWHAAWGCPVHVVKSAAEALLVIGAIHAV
jgi:DnaJ-domain-containing protein 1